MQMENQISTEICAQIDDKLAEIRKAETDKKLRRSNKSIISYLFVLEQEYQCQV